jgi:hypothetical protein
MSIVGLIITIAIVGVILWAVNTLLPMDPKIKQVLNVIVIVVLLIWLLQLFVGIGPTVGPILSNRI